LDEELKAYWELDETSGTNALGSVAGVYNGTNYGAIVLD